MKYRLYIDEIGDASFSVSTEPNNRYLSLTGVILELGYVGHVVFPAIEDLKRRHFGSHPDDPVVLHRNELVRARYPFRALRDQAVRGAFDSDVLGLVGSLDYVAITTVIDKYEHEKRYSVWRFDPYHYCLTVLVERYAMWLQTRGAVGDVLAESRGGKEDRRLKAAFSRLIEQGSEHVQPSLLASCLTSKELKVKSKANNIAGLQLVEIIAFPSYRACLAKKNKERLPEGFTKKVADILEASKYSRSADGRIDGWGRKMLP